MKYSGKTGQPASVCARTYGFPARSGRRDGNVVPFCPERLNDNHKNSRTDADYSAEKFGKPENPYKHTQELARQDTTNSLILNGLEVFYLQGKSRPLGKIIKLYLRLAAQGGRTVTTFPALCGAR